MRTALTHLILAIFGILLCTSGYATDPIVLTESNHVYFYGPVNADTVNKAQLEFSVLNNTLPTPEIIYLVLNTPGGDIGTGATLIDFIRSTKRHVKVICVECSSMGYNFLQAFGERLVHSSSTVMNHRVTVGLTGFYPEEFNSRLSEIVDLINRFETSNAKRVGTSLPNYRKLIRDEINLTGDQAVKGNHADRVAEIQCNNALITKFFEMVLNEDGKSMTVLYSACPLIRSPLGIKETLAPGVKQQIRKSNKWVK